MTRGRFRALAIGGAAGVAVTLLLVVCAIILDQRALAILGAVTGIVICVLAPLVALRANTHLTSHLDRASTRANNIEVKLRSITQTTDQHESKLSSFGASVNELDSRQVASESGSDSLSTRLSALERAVAAVNAKIETSAAAYRNATVQGSDAIDSMKTQIDALEARVPDTLVSGIQDDLEELRDRGSEFARIAFESAFQLGRDPRDLVTASQARVLFDNYVERNEPLKTRPLIENFDVLERQSLSTLRGLYKFFRSTGYWDLATIVLKEVYAKSKRKSDADALSKVEAEIELFSRPALASPRLRHAEPYSRTGPILHIVGRVLPYTQTGYTLRTHYSVRAQVDNGINAIIVGQSGISDHRVQETERYTYDGVEYFLLAGQPRIEMPLQDWVAANITSLADLVAELRPSVLHAHSDFFNALIAHSVGKSYGIPVIYESRGFWEESWLSRTITANGWDDSARLLFETYGSPVAYDLRKSAEEMVRESVDHVFTLADVMRDHILDSSEGRISDNDVSLVPNAVSPHAFPVQQVDVSLARQIGLPVGATVVGYISSMVEYEGIGTLIDAFEIASSRTREPLCLLLVGDGDYLPPLKAQVEDRRIQNVYFTGRVPHEDVLRYYGLIDIFVVPRKPSRVADLVTPLKPFEAFSTGRAVVMSDVKALNEIALQSRAVETFRAGDSADLSLKISALADDPARRREMGIRASRWVRNHRTWERNASQYLTVYKSLGYLGTSSPVIESDIRLLERGLTAGEMIDEIISMEVPPLTGWFTIWSTIQSPDELVDTGWKHSDFSPVELTQSINWNAVSEADRTWGFHLHTWSFMEPLLREYANTGERRWLELSLSIALDWVEKYLTPGSHKDDMAWYDMSVSLRTPILLHLAAQVVRVEDLRRESVMLLDAIVRHIEELEDERAFNPNNNHGFYTAAAQLHVAKYGGTIAGATRAGRSGNSRLRIMIDRQFAEDGVHLEHSPDYHRMLLQSFERAIEDGLIEEAPVRERLLRAAAVLGWMIQPDGNLVQFGDTEATHVVHAEASSLDPNTQFILSDGAIGEPSSKEMAVFREGGYVFVRTPAPTSGRTLSSASYLAFAAAFHSRTHKHADDLNVVWYDRGTEILVDSGKFGYKDLLPPGSPLRKHGFYYGSVERQYIESTRAHNTLEMDGIDQQRRNREPYRSGILDGTTADGHFDMVGRVQHADYIHRRRLVFEPGGRLIVKDAVFSQSPETRKAIVWYNIDGGFEYSPEADLPVFVKLVNGQMVRLQLHGPGNLIDPVRGQAEPIRGWRSRRDRSLEPVWSIGFEFEVDTRASVETKFLLSNDG